MNKTGKLQMFPLALEMYSYIAFFKHLESFINKIIKDIVQLIQKIRIVVMTEIILKINRKLFFDKLFVSLTI